MIFKEEDG